MDNYEKNWTVWVHPALTLVGTVAAPMVAYLTLRSPT